MAKKVLHHTNETRIAFLQSPNPKPQTRLRSWGFSNTYILSLCLTHSLSLSSFLIISSSRVLGLGFHSPPHTHTYSLSLPSQIAMDRYQKVEKPKPESPINENEIRITTQGAIRNYITYATSLLQVPTLSEICIIIDLLHVRLFSAFWVAFSEPMNLRMKTHLCYLFINCFGYLCGLRVCGQFLCCLS